MSVVDKTFCDPMHDSLWKAMAASLKLVDSLNFQMFHNFHSMLVDCFSLNFSSQIFSSCALEIRIFNGCQDFLLETALAQLLALLSAGSSF